MASAFIYDKYVTGKNFIGRKMDCTILANLLEAGENVYLYGPPESGKMSLVQQSLFNMRMMGRQFTVCQLDLFNVRRTEDFLLRMGAAVVRSCASVPEEYAEFVARYLSGSHFVFDPMRFSTCGEIVSLNWSLDRNDMVTMLTLPQRVAEERNQPFYMVFSEFQNLLMAEDFEDLFKVMEEVMASKPRSVRSCFIMMGSQVNAMKLIFEEKRFFYRQANHIALTKVDEREIVEHIVKGFLNMTGKSFDRNLAMGACELFKSNLWYVNHLAAICDALSKGFVTEAMMTEALNSMISVHEPRFISIVNDLTDHQLSLLRAVLDGVVKFSASDVIEKYHLNSSANVRRVKDALKKKEVLTFNEKDEPVILDPLFEYWVSTFYFKIKR